MKRKTRLAALVLVAALCAGFITGCGAPAKPTYTVTFDLNGGELVSGELTPTPSSPPSGARWSWILRIWPSMSRTGPSPSM